MNKATFELLDTLTDVINQACQYPRQNSLDEKTRLCHQFLSAYENAFIILEDYGVVKSDDDGYWLDWECLNKYGKNVKDKP